MTISIQLYPLLQRSSIFRRLYPVRMVKGAAEAAKNLVVRAGTAMNGIKAMMKDVSGKTLMSMFIERFLSLVLFTNIPVPITTRSGNTHPVNRKYQ